MSAHQLLFCSILVCAPSLVAADDLMGETFGRNVDYVVVVQGDASNRATISQRNRVNYTAIQQYGRSNKAKVFQNGARNGSAIKQVTAPAAFPNTPGIGYLLAYQSGAVSVTVASPFPLATATYGRAH
jgi:hypothetical protein